MGCLEVIDVATLVFVFSAVLSARQAPIYCIVDIAGHLGTVEVLPPGFIHSPLHRVSR